MTAVTVSSRNLAKLFDKVHAQSIEQYHWSSRSKRFIDTSYFSISQDDLFRC